MRFTPWATRLAMTLSLSATAFLTACGGGGGGDDTAHVRLLNLTQSVAELDLEVDSTTISSKVANGTVGSYADVKIAEASTRVLNSSTGTSISATSPTLTNDDHYTLITYSYGGDADGNNVLYRTALLQEEQDEVDANKAKLLVLNLAPDAGSLDTYVTTAASCAANADAALSTNLAGGAGSSYIQLNSGTFRVCVTGYGKRSDLRLEIPAVTLASKSINTLILTGTSSGTMVNGTTLVQQGAVAKTASALSRVRVVNSLPTGTYASATVQGDTTLLPNGTSPNIGEYKVYTAGSSNLAVTYGGSATTAGTALNVGTALQTLSAGVDYTLLVWGPASAPKVSVFIDDNRLPTSSGFTKIRLVNGMSTAAATTALFVEYTSKANSIAAGAASKTAEFSPSSGGNTVQVTSPVSTAADRVLYNPGNAVTGLTTLSSNAVYTIFVMGDPSAVTGSLYRDR
jgi:Domain of unknown function (DUF4397)